MRIPPMNIEQLEYCKKTISELSFQGFLLNVNKSLKAGLIDNEQANILTTALERR